jgi:hypothetical protein
VPFQDAELTRIGEASTARSVRISRVIAVTWSCSRLASDSPRRGYSKSRPALWSPAPCAVQLTRVDCDDSSCRAGYGRHTQVLRRGGGVVNDHKSAPLDKFFSKRPTRLARSGSRWQIAGGRNLLQVGEAEPCGHHAMRHG